MRDSTLTAAATEAAADIDDITKPAGDSVLVNVLAELRLHLGAGIAPQRRLRLEADVRDGEDTETGEADDIDDPGPPAYGDPTGEATLGPDAATADLAALERALVDLRRSAAVAHAICERWQRPHGKALTELRKLADAQPDLDGDADWCRMHRRITGEREPITTERPGERLGLCWRCMRLQLALRRELGSTEAAERTLAVLVRDGTMNPTAAQITDATRRAQGVRTHTVTATSGTKAHRQPKPRKQPKPRRQTERHGTGAAGDGKAWNDIAAYGLPPQSDDA